MTETDRTCGTCAWFDDRDKIECIDGIWVQGQPGGAPLNYIGPGRCMWDPIAVPKEPNDWCRHHATTRGWDEQVTELRHHTTRIVPEVFDDA